MKDASLRDRFCYRLTWSDLDVTVVRRLIAMARDEDLEGVGLAKPPSRVGDLSTKSLIATKCSGEAVLTARTPLAVCGIPLIPLILEAYADQHSVVPCRWKPGCHEGDALNSGAVLGTVSGEVATLLQAERLILNTLQHLSGITTYTALCVAALGTGSTRILDTRKTTPCWRFLEKYAVACGGGWNHRMGLFDRILIKDNHLAAIGAASGDSLVRCIRRVRAQHPGLIMEVEVDSLEAIEAVIAAGTDVILLDNFTPHDLRRAVALIGNRVYIEASGGVTQESLTWLSSIGLDFISCGALTHQSTWTDIGMDWRIKT